MNNRLGDGTRSQDSMVNQEQVEDVEQIIVGMQSIVESGKSNLHVNTLIENQIASVSGGFFQNVFDQPRDVVADKSSLEIREKLKEANKSIQEVMYKLSRVIDKGSSLPILDINTS